jgi:spore maturation protein SpmA
LALGLTGALALFLGLMRVASEAGLLARLARLLAPVLRRLFPGIPDGHPALSAVS